MFLKNKNIISKIKRSKVTDYAALRVKHILSSVCTDTNGSIIVNNAVMESTRQLSIVSNPESQVHLSSLVCQILSCADPESFVRGGRTLTTFYLVD